ncbi:MAG: hypothetical protein GY866_27645 [Proteobacteria bacterium]|nr:hypothetical protein [Pseudomonadota bacterium]
MPHSTLIICFLLSIVIGLGVLFKPFFRDKPQAYFGSESDTGEFDESLSLLEAISELEADYKMGKISREDFEALTLDYKHAYLERKNRESA